MQINQSLRRQRQGVRRSFALLILTPLLLGLSWADPAPTTPAKPAPKAKAAPQPKTATQLPPATPHVIVVTAATRNPQPPDTTATTSTVLTQDNLQAGQYVSVASALTQVPGLSVVPTGPPGQPTSVFIHGNDSNMTLFTIDGRRQAVNILGSYDLGTLTLDNIEQVEVVRTPSSSLQGGNSAGGVINLVSLSGRGLAQPEGSASFEAGSFDTYRGNLQSRGAVGNFDYALSASEITSNMDRPNENVRNTVYRGNFGYQITPDVYVDLHSGYSLANVGAPNAILSPNPLERVQSQDWFLSPEVVAHVTDFYTTRFYYTYDAQTLTDNNPYTDFSSNFAYDSNTQIDTNSIDWQNDFQVASNWKITAGIQGDNSRVNLGSMSPFFGNTTLQNNLTNIGGYVESEWQPIAGLNVLSSIRDDQYSDYSGAVSWRQGVAYIVPQTKTQLHASGSSAYTPPSTALLYYPGSGNPNLKPETSLGWEAGVAQPLLDGKLTPGATYFHNNITDYIQSGPPTYIPYNVGQATTQGVEVSLDARPLDNLTLNVNYTYLDAMDDTNQTRLLRRPGSTVNFTATYNPIEAVTLCLGGTWIIDRQDILYDPNTFTSTRETPPNYFLLRASATWKINSHLSVWVRGENLTDDHYQPVLGYPALGATAYAGLKVSF